VKLAAELFVTLLGIVGMGALGTALALGAAVLIGPVAGLVVGFLYVWLVAWVFLRVTE
jgi:hypothetical protein